MVLLEPVHDETSAETLCVVWTPSSFRLTLIGPNDPLESRKSPNAAELSDTVYDGLLSSHPAMLLPIHQHAQTY